MSSKKYPPLTYSEVVKILKVYGFKKDRSGGSSHEQYECIIKKKRRIVTVTAKKIRNIKNKQSLYSTIFQTTL